MWASETGVYELGDLPLQSGATLRNARLAWKSYGTLSPARDNVVVYPTSYSATHTDQEWLVRPDGILDPTRWFIVTPDLFGNGLSSSPSNSDDYPALVTTTDSVRAQRRLLHELFAIDRIAAVYGFSMGAQQAYHWAALYPGLVERAIVVCGSARTAVHNQVFLKALLAILEAAPEHLGGGRFSAEPKAALRAFARTYAGWAKSQDWYRAGLHLATASSLDDYLDREWAPGFTRCHAADLYAQACSWAASDISANELYAHDLDQALAAIEAKVLLLPGTTDLYFRVADNEAELLGLRHAELRPIPSIWGHGAGSPGSNPEDEQFLRSAVHTWLDT
ncbi:alpha/beta fold hydrolase [Lichenicola cladoniae]|uniref:Alpha/beta fold hydrolase n=1 Tax=Lichenicola cladoniae TaxID=1484109 RepID=A0A6M8HT94_9PROT|nr:alpha/beta fold hydrolase [Lichenicola cladoniae]NPD65493.1 alpha/beta fold hydrolase [Acetobacteraceae bacterium]QKE91445.1 alpha/beta fold hydrolase [Lichenicola cladoniae]